MQKINLFQKKRFQMHSGGWSDFKLECDALTTDDYDTLAFLVSRRISFKKVIGVPRGGLMFADSLLQYENHQSDKYLIVDDVLTSGKSMIEQRVKLVQKSEFSDNDSDYIGVVIFSRGKVQDWIQPIFRLDSLFWQND